MLSFFGHIRIHTATKKILAVCRWQPLTTRGFVLLLISFVGLKFYYFPQMDLVAGMLGGAGLLLALIVTLIAFILRLRLGKKLQAEAHFDTVNPRSRRPVAAGLIFSGSNLPPFFSLTVERCFHDSGVESPKHILISREAQQGRRHLIDSIVFPHRGLWSMQALRCVLKDSLGFTSFSWLLPLRADIEVSAVDIPIRPLPLVAASSRAGDELDQSVTRSGDLFDIKSYDPSDGINRILWKTYAKSGQLMVRRPEPALKPEGEVALYMIASRYDDHVAGALQNYVDQLVSQQIVVCFGTDGILFSKNEESYPLTARDFPPPPSHGARCGASYYCLGREEIQRAINRSVWSTLSGTGADFEAYLESLRLDSRVVSNVVVFAPQVIVATDRATSDGLEKRFDGSWLTRITRAAGLHSVKLSVALVPEFMAGLTNRSAKAKRLSADRYLPKRLAKLLPSSLARRSADRGLEFEAKFASQTASSGSAFVIIESSE